MKPGFLLHPEALIPLLACVLALFLAPAGVGADTLQGADDFLCTGMQVQVCTSSGGCEAGLPWDFNLPSFVEIDLGDEVMRTTEASGEDRSSPIKNLEKEDGYVFLQGIENGRAYSAIIALDPGLITFAIAADGMSITVFGACTPQPDDD